MSLVMLLACLMAAEGTLYFELMPESVSPGTTVWMMAAPFEATRGVAGADRFGLVLKAAPAGTGGIAVVVAPLSS